MLDGRVKTLHPRVHGGILADRRLADHRRQLLAAAIAPFELVVVNLYPFAAAAERPGITLRRARRGDRHRRPVDGPGGGQEPRQRGDRHLAGALRRGAGRDRRASGRVGDGLRAALAVEAFRHTAAYDARIAEVLPGRMPGRRRPARRARPARRHATRTRTSLTIALEKVESLRYGENPHQPAARYRRPGSGPADGPFATGEPPLQGKALSYNNVLDASAAAALGRALRGPAVVIVKHTNPCGAAERPTLLEAWEAALAGDPVSAFGGVVALTRPVDEPVAEALVVDLPRGRRGARVRRRPLGDPGAQAEPAAGRRPRARARRARSAARSDAARSGRPAAPCW